MTRLVLSILLMIPVLGGLGAPVRADDPLQVIATTSIIADVAQNVGRDLVEVVSLIPLNSDPHSYLPAPRDIARVVEADVVLVNGMSLEENLLDVVEENAADEPVIVSLGVPVLSIGYPDVVGDDEDLAPYIGVFGEAGLCDLEEGDDHDEGEHDAQVDAHDHGPCDPHVWKNPENVMVWAANIADAYIRVDPDHAGDYRANADAYIAELHALDEAIREQVALIPAENRVLITNHSFLNYFAVAYGFEVAGVVLPGGGTSAEADPRALIALVEIINERGIPAVFGEESVSSDLAETIAAEADHEVRVALLVTGSLSDEDGPAPSYIDFMRYNSALIVEALSS